MNSMEQGNSRDERNAANTSGEAQNERPKSVPVAPVAEVGATPTPRSTQEQALTHIKRCDDLYQDSREFAYVQMRLALFEWINARAAR